MAARNWLGEIVAKVLSIVRAGPGDELARESAALAEAEAQLGAARKALAQARDDRADSMRSALDGNVDASTLTRHRAIVGQAQARVDEVEELVRALRERKARAEHNAEARQAAAARAEFARDIDEATAQLREAFACDQRKAGCLRRGFAALDRARSKCQGLGIENWPTLWSRDRIVRVGEIDLVRTAPEIFRSSHCSYGQALVVPDFETQHRAAVEQVLPPDPRPRPAAA